MNSRLDQKWNFVKPKNKKKFYNVFITANPNEIWTAGNHLWIELFLRGLDSPLAIFIP